MENYFMLFFEEVASQGWVTILRFNGFALLAFAVGPFIRDFISEAIDKFFDLPSLIVALIFLALSCWCGWFLLGSPTSEVQIVAICWLIISILVGCLGIETN